MKKKLHPAFRRPGFTLVELLVVIAILGVLAALIFMVSRNMKNSAYKVREMSNLRSISHSVINYHSDKQVLPGRVNRGLPIPSKVAASNRHRWLSTFLIDAGYLHEDDEIFITYFTLPKEEQGVTYICNTHTYTLPRRFFGYPDTNDMPKPISALRSNRAAASGGIDDMPFSDIWMLRTADTDGYDTPTFTFPIPAGGFSTWGGRFYSFFDGRVEFFERRTPSIYPDSRERYANR